MTSDTQKCPSCGAQTSGKFCSECGATLAPASCRSCGAKLSPRAKFCADCGTPVSGAARGVAPGARPMPRSDRMAWYVAGVCVLALLAVVVVVVARKSGAPAPAAAGAGAPAGGQPATTDLSTMTPREQADRLYNRIMTAHENGDSAQVTFFAPMALQAYANLGGDLDADARLHLGLVQLAVGAAVPAAAEGDTILKRSPNHLFGWLLKARAAEAEGNTAQAKRAYQAFTKNYDAELAKKRPEYQEHAQMLQDTRSRAQRAGAAAGS
jgi:hypothetical protein